MFYRLRKLMMFPINVVVAKVFPVRYARWIGVRIKGSVHIYGSSYSMFSSEPFLVTLHNNVFVSVGAQFICHDGGVLPFRKDFPKLDLAAPIEVKENCFIGAGALILKGVTIGENSIVAANAVVTKSVPPGSVVGGNPAKIIKTTEQYLEGAKLASLEIGHLSGDVKMKEYHRLFPRNRDDF